MRNRTVLAVFVMLAATTALADPQGPKTTAPRDPELIDAQAYQKLVERYRGKPLLVNFWATRCEPCRHEYPMLNELSKKGRRRRGFPASSAGRVERRAPRVRLLRERWTAGRACTWRRIAGDL